MRSRKRLLPRGCGSVFSFDLQGSREQGRAFIEALKLFSHLANVGDCRSLVIHPASTTHFRMDDAALARAGIGPGTIRLSIGLEDADDLIDDLKRALKARREKASGDGARRSTRRQGRARPTPTPAASRSTPACRRVVFVHGALQRPQRLDAAGALVRAPRLAVLAPDLPGHGTQRRPAARERRGDGRLAARAARCRRRRARRAGRPQHGLADRARGGGARAASASTHLVLVGTAYPMKVSPALLDDRARRSAGGDRQRQHVFAFDARRQAVATRARAPGCTARTAS